MDRSFGAYMVRSSRQKVCVNTWVVLSMHDENAARNIIHNETICKDKQWIHAQYVLNDGCIVKMCMQNHQAQDVSYIGGERTIIDM